MRASRGGLIGDAVAVGLVLATLLTPGVATALSARSYVSVPVEGVLGLAVLLVLPAAARRWVAAVLGLGLGLLALLKLGDLGFSMVWDRPFDPVLDWLLLDDAARLLASGSGRATAWLILAGAALAAVGVVAVNVWAMLRLAALIGRRRSAATISVVVLAAIWLTGTLFDLRLVPGVPVASRTSTGLVLQHAHEVEASLDRSAFYAAVDDDAFIGVPAGKLLTGLRGKDVLLIFVESYGQTAVDDPEIAAELDAGTRRLAERGVQARSAYLTSPTFGGGSWLAHATLSSGLWIDNNTDHRDLLLKTDRFTLTRAFGRAGWRTVAAMPGLSAPWPEGQRFFGFDQVYDAAGLGYRGPAFSWAPVPDQYTLGATQWLERAPGHQPVMAEINLVSSHAPWSPLPRLVAWDALGDGTLFASMAGAAEPPEVILTRDPAIVRADYRRAVSYSLASVISYLSTYGDDDLVVVLLGDHQPAPVVTGHDASRDVPITILARDPRVLAAIDDWGWQPGLRPGTGSPVWRMDAFRDRFLGAYGPAR